MAEQAQLTTASVTGYLRATGVIDGGGPVRVDELGGGVSNVVLGVGWGDREVVVKQALPKLRVAADWYVDQRRTKVERDCLELLAEYAPGCVPNVLHFDESRCILVISRVPDGGVLWKDALMAGDVSLTAARAAGALLGRIHSLGANDPRVPAQFADQTVLIQSRVDPFHRTVAEAHPSLAPAITHEVNRLLTTRVTLTLGDYSPKNLFIFGDRVIAIDVEVAHWGDPAFDIAFCLTQLVLKAIHFRDRSALYMEAARQFCDAYKQDTSGLASEPAIIAELGCLLHARIDGKSPVEYITDGAVKDEVRKIAGWLISSGDSSVKTTLHQIQDTIERRPASEGSDD